MNARTIFAIAGTLALASVAMAQETINLVTVNGGAPINSGGNIGTGSASTRLTSLVSLNYTFTNSFLWTGSVTAVGSLLSGGIGSFASEARIVVTSPSNGISSSPDIQPFTTSGWAGTVNANRTQNLGGFTGLPFDPIGQTFNFRFYESFNDTAATTDATWTALSLTFNGAPTAPVATNLGSVSNSSYPAPVSGTLASGQVAWYKFNVAANTVLDMHTYFSGLGNIQTDTEIGLYTSTGALVSTNDDINGGLVSGLGNFNSALSSGGGSGIDLDGAGPGLALGTAGVGTTIPGFLAAGEYFLAVGGFNTSFDATGWGVTAGTAAGPFSLTLIPTPGAAALLGLGGLGALRRRRA